jgi:hypothetical protein
MPVLLVKIPSIIIYTQKIRVNQVNIKDIRIDKIILAEEGAEEEEEEVDLTMALPEIIKIKTIKIIEAIIGTIKQTRTTAIKHTITMHTIIIIVLIITDLHIEPEIFRMLHKYQL